jgi:hypothetical protein
MSAPARATPLFAATLNSTTPEPAPVEPAEMVIHGVLVVALQLQADVLVTVTLFPDAPFAAMANEVGAA